jgi:hypothetical protein
MAQELVDPAKAGSITGNVIAIERQDAGGDDQYVLRLITKQHDEGAEDDPDAGNTSSTPAEISSIS